MKIFEKLDKKFTIGILIGLVFGILSVYVDFFKSSEPNLNFDILSNATVFDIKENIGKLDVFYDSTSLTKQGKTLSLITLKISNTGNESILREFFEPNSPLTIHLDSAKILQIPQVIETNDNYLQKNIIFVKQSDNSLILKPFIFDKDKYFIIKLIAIHNQKLTPEIRIDGKIAKIDKFNIFSSFKDQQNESFWNSISSGNFLVHITRFFLYFLILILFVVAIILPISEISEYFSKRKRKKLVKLFRNIYENPITDSGEIFIDYYLDFGINTIERFKKIINDQVKYKNLFSIINSDDDFYFSKHKDNPQMDISLGPLIKELKNKGVMKIIDKKFWIDDEFKDFVYEFIRFMKA